MGSENLWDNEFEEEGNDDLLGDDANYDRDSDSDLDTTDKGPVIDDMDADEDMYASHADYDEFNMDDDEDADLSDEDKDKAKDEAKDEATADKTEDSTVVDKDLAKLYADVLQVVGEDTILKVKGKEIRAGDLAPEELKTYLQHGIRSNDVYHEAKRLRDEAEQLRNQGPGRTELPDPTKQDIYASVPQALRPKDNDTPEVRTLKEVIATLQTDIQSVKQTTDDTQVAHNQAQLERELTSLSKEYEMGSVDESIAVKYFRPELSLEDLMRETHQHYTSDKFLTKALKHNPSFHRQLKADAVKEYNASRQARTKRNAPTKSFRKSGGDKVSSKPRQLARNFDQAQSFAEQHLAELSRMSD